MTTKSNAELPDHRHPHLAETGYRLCEAARLAAKHAGCTQQEAVDAALAALYSKDDGEHRDVIIHALSQLSELPFHTIGDAYDSVPLPKDLPKSAKGLRTWLTDVDGTAVCDAVVRFECCHHVRLIYTFANRAAHQYDRDAGELFFDAFIGLKNALASYVPTTGTISTFAQYRMRGAIQDGMRSESPVPNRLISFVRTVETVEEQLLQSLSRAPSEREVATMLGNQAQYLHLYPRLAHQVSLDARPDAYDPKPAADTYEVLVEHETAGEVAGALMELDEPTRKAVQLVVMQDVNPREAARQLGIKQSELNALVERGLESLRDSQRLQAWSTVAA